MPINTIEYSKIMMKKLDQKAVQLLTSGWMEENAGQVIYNGGNSEIRRYASRVFKFKPIR